MRRHIEFIVFAALLACAGSASAATDSASGGKFYCCTDSAGKHVCGDILPQACYGRAYRELGADGRTLREIAAPLTAEQRAERAAEEEKRRQEEAARKEQERKDQLLLGIYASLEDLELMRKLALDDVRKAISNAEARIAEIQESRKKFEDEAEFYKNKPLPPDLEKALADTEFELKAQESIIEARKKDMAAIQEKYDEDRQHFFDIQRRKANKTP
ncbi:MAG: hypothetical protein LBS49_10085 [Candidatus Accumulibacter sp.]|nr:hypothetical protein [Accumulibacter sp.]